MLTLNHIEICHFLIRDLSEIEDVENQQDILVNGYELLPTNQYDEEDDIEFGVSTFDEQGFHLKTSHHYESLISTDSITSAQDPEKIPSIPLDLKKIDTIKSIMSNVLLPTAVIPSWAHSVTDEQLEEVVKQKVGARTPSENWANFE